MLNRKINGTESTEEDALERLHYWLLYEGLTVVLGSVFWIWPTLLLQIFILLALLFTPYLLWQLYRAGWYRAIAVFLVLVMAPVVSFGFMEPFASVGYYLLYFSPLILFYSYCWILRYLVGVRLRDIKADRAFMEEGENRLES